MKFYFKLILILGLFFNCNLKSMVIFEHKALDTNLHITTKNGTKMLIHYNSEKTFKIEDFENNLALITTENIAKMFDQEGYPYELRVTRTSNFPISSNKKCTLIKEGLARKFIIKDISTQNEEKK